tara:strand:+ start:1627 stop:1941 length:315 start_codon:yes stop_codon:yes gene_type:complete
MNYIKVKESQTIGSATKVIDVLIPLDRISFITGTTTQVKIEYASTDSGSNYDYVISGFGTLASASEGFQTVYALIDDLAKSPNTVSDYLKINGDDVLTVTGAFN